jgi:hypothetical protein
VKPHTAFAQGEEASPPNPEQAVEKRPAPQPEPQPEPEPATGEEFGVLHG